METMFSQKTQLRKLMKEILKTISSEEKLRQSTKVLNHLLNNNERFSKAKHIAVYLAMKHEEIDTIPLIESFLKYKQDGHIYVPHVEMSKPTEMVFYELKSMEQYEDEMNDNNKFKIKQFNDVQSLQVADINKFDLVIVPGLVFDKIDTRLNKNISRLGRGKGYYDVLLSKIPDCYTIGVGFNEQYIPFNDTLTNQNLHIPVIENKDEFLNEFLSEKLIAN